MYKLMAFCAIIMLIAGIELIPNPGLGMLISGIGAVGMMVIADDADWKVPNEE